MGLELVQGARGACGAGTHRPLHIGNLDVDLGRTSTIRADAITFANASWAKQPAMATADRVEIDVRMWPLLRGSVQLPSTPDPAGCAAGNRTAQETRATGFPRQQHRWGKPQLKRLRIDDGRLQFLDTLGRTDILVDVRSQPKQADTAPPLLVQGKGRWQGNPFTLRGDTESPWN